MSIARIRKGITVIVINGNDAGRTGTVKRVNRKDGTAILLVEQNANKALNVSDRAYVLASGQIELTGSGKEMAENDDVRRIYLGV